MRPSARLRDRLADLARRATKPLDRELRLAVKGLEDRLVPSGPLSVPAICAGVGRGRHQEPPLRVDRLRADLRRRGPGRRRRGRRPRPRHHRRGLVGRGTVTFYVTETSTSAMYTPGSAHVYLNSHGAEKRFSA